MIRKVKFPTKNILIQKIKSLRWNVYVRTHFKLLELVILNYIIVKIPSNFAFNFLRLSLLKEYDNLSAKNKPFIRKSN